MVYRTILLLCCFLFSSVAAFSQMPGMTPEGDSPVLSKGDITRFLETFPSIASDMETLGQSFDDVENLDALQAMAGNEQVQAILKKYGWDAQKFFTKANTIIMGYVKMELEKQIQGMPEEQRAMMRQMLQNQDMLPAISAENMALLKPYETKLRALFESMEKE